MDAGAALGCFNVTALLLVLVCTVQLQTGKDNGVFFLKVYDIFEPVSGHLGGFPSSLVINSNVIMLCK